MYLLAGVKVSTLTPTPNSNKHWAVYHILGVKKNIKMVLQRHKVD